LLLFVLVALLLGFGMHAARACQHAVLGTGDLSIVDPGPCHHGEIDVAQVACETHCRTDTQPSRSSTSIDVPEAAPAAFAVLPSPLPPVVTGAPVSVPQVRDRHRLLHLLLLRLLR